MIDFYDKILKYNFKNKKAIIRIDFNVPIDNNGTITDYLRINRSIKTIKNVLNNFGSVILIGHLGRPKNGYEEKYSLKNIYSYLNNQFTNTIFFVKDCMSDEALSCSNNLKNGEILLLENIRFYDEEQLGSINFARKLFQYGNVYINDAFSVSHRHNTSIVGLPKFFNKQDKMLGLAFCDEIHYINESFNNSNSPITAIIGGSKISDKIGFIKGIFDKVNNIIIGGGMAYTFLKSLGYKIGNSICEDNYIDLAKNIIKQAKNLNINIFLPLDFKIADKFDNNANFNFVDIDNIPDNWYGLDIGYKSIQYFNNVIEKSKSIIWNGPIGVFEFDNFSHGSRMIASTISYNTCHNKLYSLIGGGDTALCVKKFGFFDKMSYVSAGGGSLLYYIEHKSLPGVDAILK